MSEAARPAETRGPEDLERRVASLERTETALRDELDALRSRLLHVVTLVPPEHLRELSHPGGAGGSSWRLATDLFTVWDETTQLTPSDVATELKLLWQRSPKRT